MGKRGPKPKPTRLKIIQGTARKEDLERNEPKPRPLVGRCPSWLHPLAKRKWRLLAPKLEPLGLLTETDGETFALCLSHYAMAELAATTLTEEGLTVPDERGLPRKHPAAQVLRDNSSAYLKYAQQFGLSPSSRTGFELPETNEEDDELEQFMNERRERNKTR